MKPPCDSRGAPSRRRLLNWLLGVAGFANLGVVVYPIFRYLLPPKPKLPKGPIVLGKENEVAIGDGKVTQVEGMPIIWTRVRDQQWRAFEGLCTHQDCPLEFRRGEGFFCACHNGLFDLEGVPRSGPPQKPLLRLPVEKKGDELLVTLE